MTPLAAAFVILLTFASGSGHSDYREIKCRDQACVENVLKKAPDSRQLRRLRVFLAEDYAGRTHAGQTPFLPLQDLTFD